MIEETEKVEETFLEEHHPDVDVEVRFRTRRKLSEYEERVLSDMVHEMALTVDRVIRDENKETG